MQRYSTFLSVFLFTFGLIMLIGIFRGRTNELKAALSLSGKEKKK
jgi:hypothetical protein